MKAAETAPTTKSWKTVSGIMKAAKYTSRSPSNPPKNLAASKRFLINPKKADSRKEAAMMVAAERILELLRFKIPCDRDNNFWTTVLILIHEALLR